jgi:hypothetical protein
MIALITIMPLPRDSARHWPMKSCRGRYFISPCVLIENLVFIRVQRYQKQPQHPGCQNTKHSGNRAFRCTPARVTFITSMDLNPRFRASARPVRYDGSELINPDKEADEALWKRGLSVGSY